MLQINMDEELQIQIKETELEQQKAYMAFLKKEIQCLKQKQKLKQKQTEKSKEVMVMIEGKEQVDKGKCYVILNGVHQGIYNSCLKPQSLCIDKGDTSYQKCEM